VPNTAGETDEGVLTTDRELVVRSWDAWLAEATGIPAEVALGRALASLFPEVEERGLLRRLRRVADEGTVEMLAPAFHHYLIPCAPRQPAAHFTRMQQFVTLSPIRADGEVVGITVAIRDVTARREREVRMAGALKSDDESVRMEAVEALAAAEASPDVLVDAFDDASWRVRQAAVEAVAQHHGEGVVEVLARVLREQHRDLSVLNATLSALAASGDDVVPALLELLATPDADLRVYVALALGMRGDLRAVPALVAALDDEDANVRFHALEALGRLRARDAAPDVARVAESRDFAVAFAALDALAAIGDETVTPRILPLLDDDFLRSAAVDALGRLGGEEVVAPLAALLARGDVPADEAAGALAAIHARYHEGFGDGEVIAALAGATIPPEGGRRLAAGLATASAPARPALARVLGWLPAADGADEALVRALDDPASRAAAADGLVRRGSRGADALVAGLGSVSEDALRTAALTLGRIGSPAAVPALLELLESAPEAMVAVAGALGAIGDHRAFDPLLRLLDHPQAAVRQAAVGALSSIGHPGLRERVLALLESPTPEVRESAARIAAYFGYEGCVERLVALCKDEDAGVRRAAVENLACLDDPRIAAVVGEALRGAAAPERAAAARALARLEPGDAAPLLPGALADPDLWVRYYAARSAGAARLAELAPALVEVARQDPAVPVRIAAVQALGEVGSAASAAALADDPEPEVRLAVLAVLAGTADEEALRVLRPALAADDETVRRAVLEGLGPEAAGALGDEVAAAARAARDPATARAAAYALLRAGSPESQRRLCALAAEPALRDTCVEVLARTPAGGMELLAGALREGDAAAREAILAALPHLAAPAAARLAAAVLDDPAPTVRRAAALALSRLDLRTAAGLGRDA
jgi:HEAT repeat protein